MYLRGSEYMWEKREFLYLIVKVSVDGELGLDLPFEESIVEFLVVDVDLSHLGTNLLSHFGFHSFGILLRVDRKTELLIMQYYFC